MRINFYNSLSNKIEEFIPLNSDEVSIYYCGPTVYNYVHIGNLRPTVIFDILKRFLLSQGYNVKMVSNYTDIDDKIINTAIKEGISEKELSEKFIKIYQQNLLDINALPLDETPRVSNYIPQIIGFIAELIEQGFAYEKNGNVYFRVEKIDDYGALANIKIDDLFSGARVDADENKESPLDFALWKKTTVGVKFVSPWGEGRPGWHSECVVMIKNVFNSNLIDIHGGGFDLKFPHHTNEIAQCEGNCGTHLANIWMHNGFVNIDNVKMSKSLGNVKKATDMLETYGGNVVRFALFSTHYRAPINFSEESLASNKIEVEKIFQAYKSYYLKLALEGKLVKEEDKSLLQEFNLALADDLNIANALSELYKVLKLANTAIREKEVNYHLINYYFFTLTQMLYILGMNFVLPTVGEEEINLYQQYLAAKEAKKFIDSDLLRKQLLEKSLI